MDEKQLIKRLKQSDDTALEQVIGRYTAYVATVIANQLGGFFDSTVVEELAADVFFTLWKSRKNLSHLRGWLGAVARNKAKDYLRKLPQPPQPLEEDCMICADDCLFDTLERQEQARVIDQALRQMQPQEREILVRYYFHCQTVAQTAQEMDLHVEAAKSRLQRSRAKLKGILEKGGYFS